MAAPTVTADYMGGIAGRINGGSIINSYNCGAINSSTDAASVYANIMVAPSAPSGESGASRIGGIAGYMTNSGKITNVYNRGKVEGSTYVGGVVGQLSSGTVSYAYYLISCATAEGGAVQFGVGASSVNGTTADTGTIMWFSEAQYFKANDQGFTTLLGALQTWQQQSANTSYYRWVEGADSWPTFSNEIVVKYEGNGATNGAMSDQNIQFSQIIQLFANNFSKTGYTVTFNYYSGTSNTTQTTNYVFDGWKASAAGGYWGTSADAVTTAITTDSLILNLAYITRMINLDLILTAQWSAGSITLPTPTRAGYAFQGWYTAASSGTKVGDAGATYTPTADITLYAQWVESTYIIHYDGNGATGGEMSDKTVLYTEYYSLAANKYTKTDYIFVSWNTQPDGSGKTYAARSVVDRLTATPNGVVTLYAQWAQQSQWTGGSGTEADPYIITTETQLRNLSTDVNSGINYRGEYFKLGADITLMQEFTPIGYEYRTYYFGGTFDGDGHTISGLNVTQGANGQNNVGLFGFINYATIKNLTVAGTVSGNQYVGGIVGDALESTITNVTNNCTVVGAQCVGGVVGRIDSSTVINSCNFGNVNGTNNVGGILGNGTYDATIRNSYNHGNITGTSYGVGGIAGNMEGVSTITNVYNIGTISGSSLVGGVLGGPSSSRGTYGPPNWSIAYAYYLNGNAIGGTRIQNGVGASSSTSTTADTGTIIGFNESQTLNSAGCGGATDLLTALQNWQQQPDNTSYESWIQGADGWPRFDFPVTIKYNANGASGEMSDQTVMYSEITQLRENTFTNTQGYTVTFNHNGSEQTNTTQTANYTFAGWKSSVAGGYYGTSSTAVTTAITIDSIIPNNAYVTGLTNSLITLTAQWAGSITLPTPTRAGYTFNGWYTAATGGTKVGEGGASYTPTANITLYAQWTAKSYTVSFNPNGGSVSPTSKDVVFNAAYGTLPTPTRTGYTFTGWYTKSDAGTLVTTETIVLTASNHTIFAHWTPTEYVITYEENNDTLTGNKTQNYNIETNLTLQQAPTRIGYMFTYWTVTTPNGNWENGNTFTASQTVGTGKYGNITLTAQWQPYTYTVVYNGNGSTNGSTNNSVHTYDIEQQLTENGFEREYQVTFNHNGSDQLDAVATATYTFDCWNTKENGTGTTYQNTKTVVNLTTELNGVFNLYAQWLPDFVTLPTPTRAGYTFSGWYDASSGGTKIGLGEENYIPTANITLYAKWTAKSYTVTFDANYGSVNTTNKVVTFDDAYGSLPMPTRTGYTFVGWYGDNLIDHSQVVHTGYISENSISETLANDGKYYSTTGWIAVSPNTTYTYSTDGDRCRVQFKNSVGVITYYSGSTNSGITRQITTANDTAYMRIYMSESTWNYAQLVEGTTALSPVNAYGTVTSNTVLKMAVNHTLHAAWTPTDYTITYEPNNGTLAEDAQQSYTIETNLTLQQTPSRIGYVFKNWEVTTATGNWTSGHTFTASQNIGIGMYGNIILTANWTPNTYTVVYNGNGATGGSTNSSLHTYDTPKSLTANGFTRTNHVFAGWNSMPDASGTLYLDKESVKNLTATPNGTVELYAQWLSYSNGSGTIDDPYVITTEAQLIQLAKLVNSGIPYSGTAFQLGNSIILTQQFNPIGYSASRYFAAIFDGAGFEVSNLNVTANPGLASDYLGLFGYTSGATIKNLSVSGEIAGNCYLGGIVGYACNTTLSNSYSSVNITGSSYIGGIAGFAESTTITNVYTHGTVLGNSYVGALIGSQSDSSITFAYYSTGCATDTAGTIQYGVGAALGSTTTDISGEIIGFNNLQALKETILGTKNLLTALKNWQKSHTNYLPWTLGTNGWPKLYSTITITYDGNSETSGEMNTQNVSYKEVSQLLPNQFAKSFTITYNYNGFAQPNTTESIACTFAGWTANATGGFYGITLNDITMPIRTTTIIPNQAYVTSFETDNITLTASWTASSVILPTPKRENYIFAGWDTMQDGSSALYYTAGSNYVVDTNTTLYAQWIKWSAGTGVQTDPYIITTETELRNLAKLVNSGSTTFSETYFKLGNSINLTQQFYPIGYSSSYCFAGTFDGDNHTISDLNVTISASGGTTYLGLFGYVNDATIQNLTVSGDVLGGRVVGGVVGYASGNTTIANVCNYCNISGDSYLGGIAGYVATNSGTITNASNHAEVIGSGYYIGGIAGYLSNNTVTNAYNSNSVLGVESVGGIVGYMSSSTVVNVYNRGEVMGSNNYVGGVVGQLFSGNVIYAYYLTNYAVDGSGQKQFGVGSSQLAGTTEDTNRIFAFDDSQQLNNPAWGTTNLLTALQNWQMSNTAYLPWTLGLDGWPKFYSATTIVFDGNGATSGEMPSQTMHYTDVMQLAANKFTRTGFTVTFNYNALELANTTQTSAFTFKGWQASKANGYYGITPSDITTQITADTIVPNQVYVANFGTDIITFKAQWDAIAVTLPTPTRTGYTFAGWATTQDDSSATYPAGTSYIPTENITLYAKWTAKSYTITFNANGGSVSPATKTVTFDNIYGVLPTPTRNAFTFNGWFSQADGGMQITSTSTVKLTDDLIVYAHWTPIKYFITYETTSGTLIDNTLQEYFVETNLTLREIVTAEGYTFNGWKVTTADGNWNLNDVFTNGQNVGAGKYGNVTLTTTWQPITYALDYNLDGGTVDGENPTNATYDVAFTLISPIKHGYVFEGWTAAVAKTAKYMVGSTEITWNGSAYGRNLTSVIFKNLLNQNQTITLTATWSARADTPYTVNHYLMNVDGTTYTLTQSQNFTGKTDAEITPDVYYYTGFTAPQTQTVVIKGDGKTVVDYMYTRNSFTLTLLPYTGSLGIKETDIKGSGTYFYEQPVTIKAEKVKALYNFIGWLTEDDDLVSSNLEYTFTMPNNPLTYYVKSIQEAPEHLMVTILNGQANIHLYTNNSDEFVDLVIPETISVVNGYAVTGFDYVVTSISPNAFNGKQNLKSIVLPETIDTIGSYAFANCNNLSYIEIASSNVEVGNYAFGVSVDDAEYAKTVLINSEEMARNIVGSVQQINPNKDLSDYGNLLVGVESLYINSSIVTLSEFIKSSFVRSDETITVNDITYYVYSRVHDKSQGFTN